MNGLKVLAGEYALAVGMESWRAIRDQYVPFPALLIRSSFGFGVLALLSFASEELAAVLGAGFLIVLFIKHPEDYTGKPQGTYGQQSNMPQYDNEVLRFGSNKKTDQGDSIGPQSNTPAPATPPLTIPRPQ